MEPEQVAEPVADARATPSPAQEPRTLTADEQQASPEEQALYERFVAKAWMLVYDKQFLPQAVEMLKGEGDPIEGLARVTAMVVSRVMQLAKEAGQEIGGDVLFHGAKEIFEDLAELARVTQIKDFSQDEDALEGAYFRALDHFRMTLEGNGEVNRQAAQADLEMLQRMDEAGELEALFRDLAAQDDAGREPPAEDTATEPQSQPEPRKGGNGLMPKGNN